MNSLRESHETLLLAGEALGFVLRRSARRRTLALRVTEAGEVVVNAPARLGLAEIQRFLHRHAEWLAERRNEAAARVFEWRAGAALPYRGGLLALALAPAPGRARVWRVGADLMCTAAPAQAAPAVLDWYRREARGLCAERLAHWSAQAGLACPPPMRLSDARTRWGSLSATGVVALNWRLVKASPPELDYVICHELAHLRQRNHSPAFWREVATLFPDWAAVRRRLRENGRLYFRF